MRYGFIHTNGIVSCCNVDTQLFPPVSAEDSDGRTILKCSNCNKQVFILFRSKYRPVVLGDYEGCMVKRHKPHVDYSTKTSAHYEGKYGNKYRKVNLDALIYNYKTGMLYNLRKTQFPRKMKAMSCLNNTFSPMQKHFTFIVKCLELRTKELLPEIDLISILCNYFGVVDTGKAEDFVRTIILPESPSARLAVSSGLTSYMFFNIMKHPKMALLPINDYGRVSKLSRKFFKAKNQSAALKAVFNNIGKVFRRYLKENAYNPDQMNVYTPHSNFIPNFYTLTKLFKHDVLKQAMEKINWDSTLFHGIHSWIGFSAQRMNAKQRKMARVFIERIGERRLLNQMMKHHQTSVTKNTIGILLDTLMSWEGIYEVMPDFYIKRQNTLQSLHDYISKERRKVVTPNEVINYTEEEISKYNKRFGIFEFRLAQNTHELVDVGNEMDICVGGYGGVAVNRFMNIIVLYKHNKPVVCMETTAGFTHVRQAKMYQNGRACKDARLCRLVKAYCKKNHIETECYDLSGVFSTPLNNNVVIEFDLPAAERAVADYINNNAEHPNPQPAAPVAAPINDFLNF